MIHCDALSLNLVAIVGAGAAGLWSATTLRLPLAPSLAIAALATGAGAAIFAALEPACLAGPFPSPSFGALRRFGAQLVLIVICMVTARTWAMVVNRLADRDFDRQNQRTRRRIFASVQLGVQEGKSTLLLRAGWRGGNG